MKSSTLLSLFWILQYVHGVYGNARFTEEEQRKVLITKLNECHELMVNASTTWNVTEGSFCPVIWDKLMCWPQTPAGEVASQPCPPYIHMFNPNEIAFRKCSVNGSWVDPRENTTQTYSGWTNYSLCPSNETQTLQTVPPLPGLQPVILLVRKHLEEFRLMYNVGYGLSLISLLIAVFIMAFFRKLHCPRNYIHLNLFVSFLLRALLNIIRENVWVHYLGFPSDLQEHADGRVTFTDGSHFGCRLFFSAYQYAIVASYMWIFVEAIYIHMVIFIAIFTEKTKVVCYMIFGWSLPLPFVIAWAISRIYLDNSYCWSLSLAYSGLNWIINAPVMLSVILNAIFFVNIVRLLLTKLNSFPHSDTNRYRTLAKSVVVLIPLFGVHFLVFQLPVEEMGDTASFVFLVIEMFFNSYQGLFIAVLLCFTNAEVRNEVKRSWSRMYLRRCSTASRASQMANQQRSFSTTTKISEITRLNSLNKRYAVGRKSSASDVEQTVPFTTTTLTPSNEEVCEDDDSSRDQTREMNSNGSNNTNGHVTGNPDELELKINVVNIECKSRDGVSRNTTSLDIQAMKHGRTISTENILNNNVQETTLTQGDNRNLEQRE